MLPSASHSDHKIDYIVAKSVSDDEIRGAIQQVRYDFGLIICPHTATSFYTISALKIKDWIAVSTAHPAKFKEIVEPIIRQNIPMPPNLDKFLNRSKNYKDMKPDLKELVNFLEKS